jgi:hypothetical protein
VYLSGACDSSDVRMARHCQAAGACLVWHRRKGVSKPDQSSDIDHLLSGCAKFLLEPGLAGELC